jgi:hypothetical protein
MHRSWSADAKGIAGIGQKTPNRYSEPVSVVTQKLKAAKAQLTVIGEPVQHE